MESMRHGSKTLMKHANLGNTLFDGTKVRKGYLRIEGEFLAEICEGDPPSDAVRGLVLPGFANAHTHLGDSFAYPAPRLPPEKLVASPGGYKHQSLKSASKDLKMKGMLESLDAMVACGTSIFADFREEGVEGVRTLDGALRDGHPRAIRLGRPCSDEADDREIGVLLDVADGIGMSAVSDHPIELLERLSKLARARGKLFSIHMSESRREDVDAVLSLRPDFVVHATNAPPEDLAVLADAGIPVVVCPRSNEFFGIKIDIPRMVGAGLTVALGTDNGMISRPDMFEEMRAANRVSAAMGGIEPLEVVRMATVQGRKVLKAEGNTTAGAKNEDDFTVVKVPGDDPLRELVTTVGSGDVLAVVRGRKVRRFAP